MECVRQDGEQLNKPAVIQALSAEEIKSQAAKILEVMKSVMKEGVHYGKIPGCGKKPTLFKPGSEKLLSTFRIACTPIATDLSASDEIRYRVETRATSMHTEAYLGSGLGECSSKEERYAWRRAVCDEEYNGTAEDHRRAKWIISDGKAIQIKQVQTNPADIANTVLKMAKKRSQIDMTLTVTAASDVFQQDIEDLPDDVRETVAAAEEPGAATVKEPTRKSQSNAPASASHAGEPYISDAQRKRLYAIYKNSGISDDQMRTYLTRHYQLDNTNQIKRSDYEKICQWAASPKELRVEGSC